MAGRPVEEMTTRSAILVFFVAGSVFAQSPSRGAGAPPPDLSGVWSPAGGRGPGAPAPSPLLLKSGFKERYDAQRAKERAASARGEQLATAGLCEPYGMPGMMQVAVYPMEIIQRPEQ